LVHNPTVCLPAAGLSLVNTLPQSGLDIGFNHVGVHGWEFERDGQRIFVFVATRWERNFDLFVYQQGDWRKRLGNFWRAAVGNRGNALQTLELVGVGYASPEAAEAAVAGEFARLAGDDPRKN
ncbi:MAG TPA: hypothetical protein VGC39_11620, partial [Candidatus Methylacidiphilales bacterium]